MKCFAQSSKKIKSKKPRNKNVCFFSTFCYYSKIIYSYIAQMNSFLVVPMFSVVVGVDLCVWSPTKQTTKEYLWIFVKYLYVINIYSHIIGLVFLHPRFVMFVICSWISSMNIILYLSCWSLLFNLTSIVLKDRFWNNFKSCSA